MLHFSSAKVGLFSESGKKKQAKIWTKTRFFCRNKPLMSYLLSISRWPTSRKQREASFSH